MVRVLRDGVPVKMSKRSGDIVELSDVVDEVGRDPVRFMMLFRKNDAMLDFDLAKVVEQSRDNPVFYVQYAHARCRSVFRQAAETFGQAPGSGEIAQADFGIITDSADFDLLKRLSQYPRVIEQAALAHEPHRIAFYLYDLAGEFHALWNKGKDVGHLRFVNQTDRSSTLARLGLVRAVETVIKSGLSLLGVSAPEEMR
jgi:arginyl-tRNA synthetase